MKKFNQIFLAVGFLAIAGSATAVPIVGDVAFSSETNAYWTPVDGAWTSTSIASATGISFFAGDNTFDQNVVHGSGSFAGTEGTGANFIDFQFDPLAAGSMLWTFDYSGATYSLTMGSITSILKGSSTIALEGTGFMSITGYDDTYGSWDFSGNTFSFSSSAVPEPGIALLLGVGLIGFGVSRKLRKIV